MDKTKIAKELVSLAKSLTAAEKVQVLHSVHGDIFSIVVGVIFNYATNLNEVTAASNKVGKIRDLFAQKSRELSASMEIETLSEITPNRNRIEVSSHFDIEVHGETAHLELQDFLDRF